MTNAEWNRAVEYAQKGSHAAFEDIYRSMWDEAFHFTLKEFGRVFSAADAEDVVQQAFCTAWEKLPTLNNTPAFRSWFFRILIHKGRAGLRVRLAASIVRLPEDLEIDPLVLLTPELAKEAASAVRTGRDPLMILVHKELVIAAKQRIRKVYEDLTDAGKKVFTARVINLFNETQAASRTGLPIGTVRSATSRILEALNREFRKTPFRQAPDTERILAFTEAIGDPQFLDERKTDPAP